MTRATEALSTATTQWRACAAVLVGLIIAGLDGHPWATSLLISAGIASLVFTALLAGVLQRVRDRAIDLIADGRETIPISAVQRQRARLLTPRRRSVLAGTLDTMIRQATRPPTIRPRGARPLFDRQVIANVGADLRGVSRLLRKEHARARGVAVAERLITDGGSPLYARDEQRLREELHRITHLLNE